MDENQLKESVTRFFQHGIKQRNATPEVRREICKTVHCLQFEKLEEEIERALNPLFSKQLVDVVKTLKDVEITAPDAKKTTSPTGKKTNQNAEIIAKQAIHPKRWKTELIDRTLPVIVKGMLTGIKSEIQMASRNTPKNTKGKTTATEWLDLFTIENATETVFDTPYGEVPIQLGTEIPEYYKREIENRLRETFYQDYWEKVNETTLADITKYLENGIQEGQSIEQIARNIETELIEQGRYGRQRARTIARTESGNALNGARNIAMDSLLASIGEEVPIKKVWLSVLGNTTRDQHADLDGVPADKDGMWEMVGMKVRWPGDVNLPPEMRINCQCTIMTEIGMTDKEADQLRQDYADRVARR